MEYKRKNNSIYFRLDRGEEVLAKLNEIAVIEKIKLAQVAAIGASEEFVIGVYNVNEKKYYSKTFTGTYEITSLIGNISRKDGDIYLHLHINCSTNDYAVIGGHLNKCKISGTLEGVILFEDIDNNRILDKVTGLNLLHIK